MKYYANGAHLPYPCFNGGGVIEGIGLSKDNQALRSAYGDLTILEPNVADPEQGKVAYIASDYNTGWMHGDIKLATLSDTDTTNAVGTELVTNGDGSSTTGWSSVRGATLSVSGGNFVVSANTGSYGGSGSQGITTVVGETYTLSFQLISASGGNSYVAVRDNPDVGGGSNFAVVAISGVSAGMYSATFTATGTTTYIVVVAQNPNGVTTVDNVSVRLAEEDRSVNNKGLQVLGTVTKTAVATGADLVSYSGFTSSNYLKQPYNADLQFGTGDFSSTWWFKSGGDNGTYQWLFERQAGELEAFVFSGTGILRVYVGGTAIETGQSVFTGAWHQLCFVRRSGVGFLYLDGQLKSSTAMTGDMSTTNSAPLTVGARNDGTYPVTGHSLALLRISATVPTAEQIKKIYNDERHLFATNAKATLYGTSDAVTALAYDDGTELLHAGTSAGRSVFQGLNRVDNTTDAVGTSISASNGLVAED
jgi:hypothetical protein